MNMIDLLIDRVETARTWTCNLVEGVDASRWFEQPAPDVQHIAWQVGHLAASQVSLIHGRCCGKSPEAHLPATFTEQFGRGSRPTAAAAAYPPIAEIRRVFDGVHAEAIALIRTLPEEELDAPTAGGPHPMFVTKGQCIAMAAMHESFHAGQIALMRRIFGMPPLR